MNRLDFKKCWNWNRSVKVVKILFICLHFVLFMVLTRVLMLLKYFKVF